jgi:membrane fusion protein (multidrug efflux system)
VLVFAQQQAARYQDLAQKGAGSVQKAQQFASQLHRQEAALQSAQASVNLAQRQVETLKAQRMSAEAALAQAKAQLRRAVQHPGDADRPIHASPHLVRELAALVGA